MTLENRQARTRGEVYERDNKVLVRSHSGTRGWFQPWPFTDAFTRCNYPACPRIDRRKSSLDSIRVKGRGRSGTRCRRVFEIFFFFFFLVERDIFVLFNKQGRLVDFFPTIKSWIIGSVGIAIFALRGGFSRAKELRDVFGSEIRFFENSHIFYSRCKGFLSFDARNAINRFETKNRRTRRIRRYLLLPRFFLVEENLDKRTYFFLFLNKNVRVIRGHFDPFIINHIFWILIVISKNCLKQLLYTYIHMEGNNTFVRYLWKNNFKET